MARPTKQNPKGLQKSHKLDSKNVQKLEWAFAIDSSVGEACYYAGISRSCYYIWINKHPELLDKFTRLRHTPILKARQTIVKNLGNPKIAMWYLEHKLSCEFGRNKTIDETINYELKIDDKKYEKILKRAYKRMISK